MRQLDGAVELELSCLRTRAPVLGQLVDPSYRAHPRHIDTLIVDRDAVLRSHPLSPPRAPRNPEACAATAWSWVSVGTSAKRDLDHHYRCTGYLRSKGDVLQGPSERVLSLRPPNPLRVVPPPFTPRHVPPTYTGSGTRCS